VAESSRSGFENLRVSLAPRDDEAALLEQPSPVLAAKGVGVGSGNDQIGSALYVLSMEVASTRRGPAGDRDLETAEQVLADLEGFEHLTTEADDRFGAFEDARPIVRYRVVGEAAGKPIPVTVIERGGIANQHIVDRLAIEKILKS
jgi:hypothetical protein